MIRMQALKTIHRQKSDVTVKWVTLEENVLRQRVTTISRPRAVSRRAHDRHLRGPIWAKKKLAHSARQSRADYDAADLLPKISDAVSVSGKAVCRAVLWREFDGHVSH